MLKFHGFSPGDRVVCSELPGKKCTIVNFPIVGNNGAGSVAYVSYRTKDWIEQRGFSPEVLCLENKIAELARRAHFEVPDDSSLEEVIGIKEILKFTPFKDVERKISGVMLRLPDGSFEVAAKTWFGTQMYWKTLPDGTESWKQNFSHSSGRAGLLFAFVEKAIPKPAGRDTEPIPLQR